MSFGIAEHSIMGRLTADPRVFSYVDKRDGTERKGLDCSVAVNLMGSQEPQYYKFTLFDRKMDNFLQVGLGKGDGVYLNNGRMEIKAYIDKNNEPKASAVLINPNWTVPPSMNMKQAEAAVSEAAPSAAAEETAPKRSRARAS